MKVYISGQMTGKPDLNRAAFAYAEQMLRDLGYDPVNPHKLSPPRLKDETDEEYYDRCIKIDLAELEKCERIYFLVGWMRSNGAVKEFNHACKHGIKVLT